MPEADRSKEERLQAVDPGRTGHWNRTPRDPTEAVGRRPSVTAPSSWSAHRTRLRAGIAAPAGVEMARAHGVEPEVMGAGADLQRHRDSAFVAWLGPRLGGAEAARPGSVES
jgi:hypothetical protein